jgi:hypothetical protein
MGSIWRGVSTARVYLRGSLAALYWRRPMAQPLPSSRATRRNHCDFNRAFRAGHRRRPGTTLKRSGCHCRRDSKMAQTVAQNATALGTFWLGLVAGRVQRLMAQARREIVAALLPVA